MNYLNSTNSFIVKILVCLGGQFFYLIALRVVFRSVSVWIQKILEQREGYLHLVLVNRAIVHYRDVLFLGHQEDVGVCY